MDFKELKQFESIYQPSKEIAFCWGRKQYVQLSVEENHTEIVDHANDSLCVWKAAKASAVPDGYVVVPKEPTYEMVEAGSDAGYRNGGHIESIWNAMIEAAQEQS